MSSTKNFSLLGVGTAVQFGKNNGQIVYDGTNGFRIRNSANNADTTLLISDGTALNSATTKNFVETYYTGINGLSVSNGTFSLVLNTDSGLSTSSSGLTLDYSTLTSLGTTAVAGTSLIAISQSGTLYSTTAQNFVNSIITVPPSATVGTIVADGIRSSFTIGNVLPNYTNLTTYVSTVIFNITSIFTGGSAANAYITDGTNILMVSANDDISMANAYMTSLPLTFNSNGSQCYINFVQADGVTPAVPTAGSATIAIEYVLGGVAGTGSGANGSVNITTGTGLTGGPILGTGVISMGTSGVTPGTYGDSTHIPTFTVDLLGRITSAGTTVLSTGTGTVTKVVAGTGLTGGTVTTTGTISLGTTGVTAGTYQGLVVNSLGQITSASNQSYGTGNVTSVAVVGSNGINVTGSPITDNGTINLSLGTITPTAITTTGSVSSNNLILTPTTSNSNIQAIVYATTTDNNPKQLYLDGSSQQLIIPINTTWLFELKVAARRTNALNESDIFWFNGGIDRQNVITSTALIGTAMTSQIEQSTAWTVDISADIVNGALVVTVAGEAGKTIKWTGYINIIQVQN